jgi:type I restriction enzyme S subunit
MNETLHAEGVADTGAEGDRPPEGWAWPAIGEVTELNPSKPSRNALPGDAPVTFVPMPAVDAARGSINAPEERPFHEVRKGYTAFRDEDVIFAKITPCMENGKVAIARGLMNGLGFGSTEFHVLRPSGAVISEYLYHFLRQTTFRQTAEAQMTGSVGQKRVPADFLTKAALPLPPRCEQQRIVAQVERLLARVDAARERIAKLPALLKRFRQAILAAACSGRLTADWRENRQSAESATALLDSVLARRRTLMGDSSTRPYKDPPPPELSDLADLPEEWAVASMEQLTCLVTSGSRGWAKYYADSGPFFIRAQNVKTDRLILDEAAHVQPPDGAEGRRTQIRYGDLLITITGANVTKSALVESDPGEAYVSQHLALIRPVDPSTSPCLYLWTVSPVHGRAKLTSDAYGAGKPGLNLDNIRTMAVGLPPVAEQREIVRRVDALFSLADALERRAAAATAHTDRLTQAILAKAFRGELVPTEAELARREGRPYESAVELLARIQAERPTSPARRPRRRAGSPRRRARQAKPLSPISR